MSHTLTDHSLKALQRSEPGSWRAKLLAGASRWLSTWAKPPDGLSPLERACYRSHWVASGEAVRAQGRVASALTLADGRVIIIHKAAVAVFKDAAAVSLSTPLSQGSLPSRAIIPFDGGAMGLPRLTELRPVASGPAPADLITRTDGLALVINGLTLRVFHNSQAFYQGNPPVIEIPMIESLPI